MAGSVSRWAIIVCPGSLCFRIVILRFSFLSWFFLCFIFFDFLGGALVFWVAQWRLLNLRVANFSSCKPNELRLLITKWPPIYGSIFKKCN